MTVLKQRLVGAIVLACIVLIMWPVIFTGPAGPALDRRSQIPEMPAFKKFENAKPIRSTHIEAVADQPNEQPVKSEVASSKPMPVTPASSKPIPSGPHLDSQGLPVSWVLQVASFSKAANAEELKGQLQKQGYKAYTRKVSAKDGKAIRVFVGPKLTQAAFKPIKKAIDSRFKVSSMVIRFEQ